MNQVDITEIGKGVYSVFSIHCKDSIAMTTEELLELAAWVEAHLKGAEPTIADCPYCYGAHEASNVEKCPLNPHRKVIPFPGINNGDQA